MITSATHVKTNYFRVTDEKEFRSLISDICVRGNSHSPEILTITDDDNATKYAITATGSLLGINIGSYEEPDYDFDTFVRKLQTIIPDDDAVIIYSIGYDVPYYVSGKYDVITNKTWVSESLKSLAEEKARACLNNPNWTTRSFR